MQSLIFSGVQPTGNLHLGNYLGAIKNWVALQHQHDCMFCIVDMHAITVFQEPTQLKQAIRETAAAYIACGIDPEKQIIFTQSTVSAHAELAWILNCHTQLGPLLRMTQFNEKSKELAEETEIVEKEKIQATIKFKESASEEEKRIAERIIRKIVIPKSLLIPKGANLGLFAYPVLMAADILAYKATHVPVGEDQKQHLELARDIAGAFNRAYCPPHRGRDGVGAFTGNSASNAPLLTSPLMGEELKAGFFPLPEPLILGEATRVMSLRDGTKKMSKSDESDFSRIHLMDDADTISQKIKKAKSDMVEGPIRYDLTARPEASNLLTIYAAIQGISRAQAEAEIASDNFSAFKTRLADALIAHLSPIRAKMVELLADEAELDRILKKGTERAAAIAAPILKEVKETIGFPVQ